jgi:hypothetical protein
MTEPMPRDLRRFELCQVASIVLSLGYQILHQASGIAGGAFGSALILLLTFLVSRRRLSWPRWALLVFYLLGFVALAYVVLELDRRVTVLTGAVMVAGYLLQAVALALSFSRQSSGWLRQLAKFGCFIFRNVSESKADMG